MNNKRFITNRLEDELINMIDELLPYTKFQSRTAFFREALCAYYSFVKDSVERERAIASR